MASQDPISSDGHGFRIGLPNTTAGASLARRQFIRFIEHFRLRREVVADIETVIGEALANAAEHGYKRHGTIRVEALLREEYLEASVSDDGPGFFLRGPISVDHPPAHSPRGFGLFLIRALVEELEFRDDGKTVWFRKRLGTAGVVTMSQESDPGAESNPASNMKTEAIYSLRDAAEAKAIAEVKADANPTPAARDALLEARLELEAKTQDAVEACHECGQSHAVDAPHYVDNVLPFKNTDRS
jgi:anti-sigma regulatory factor (Ser/Thr protein kinase)